MNSPFHSVSKLRGGLIALALGLTGILTAHATPILGGQIIAGGGEVDVVFLGSDAGYTNLLFLAPDNSTVIFNGHTTAPGTTVNLGTFAAGTELIFQINNQQGNIWSTGAASRNSDNQFHASVDTSFAPGWTWVGFEDLPGGGDRDYNDLIFKVSNGPANVPDASATAALLGLSLAGLLGFARRLRA